MEPRLPSLRVSEEPQAVSKNTWEWDTAPSDTWHPDSSRRRKSGLDDGTAPGVPDQPLSQQSQVLPRASGGALTLGPANPVLSSSAAPPKRTRQPCRRRGGAAAGPGLSQSEAEEKERMVSGAALLSLGVLRKCGVHLRTPSSWSIP